MGEEQIQNETDPSLTGNAQSQSTSPASDTPEVSEKPLEHKEQNILQKIIVLLLYLTPIGYILRFIKLDNSNGANGLHIDWDMGKQVNVFVKPDPTFNDRLIWLSSGILLVSQTLLILRFTSDKNDLFGAYAILAMLFGSVNLMCGLFPKFPWNNRKYKISPFEIFYLALGFAVVAIFFS